MSTTAVATPDPDDEGHDEEVIIDRQLRAVMMRNVGGTWAQIAATLKISATQARKDYQGGLRQMTSVSAEDMIARQRSIVHDVIRSNYKAMAGGDIDAGKLILSALEREAKLFGLDAPARLNVGVSDIEFAERTASLIEVLGLQPPKELVAGLPRAKNVAEIASAEAIDAEIVDTMASDNAPAHELPFDLGSGAAALDPDFDSDFAPTPEAARDASSRRGDDPNKSNKTPRRAASAGDGWSNL